MTRTAFIKEFDPAKQMSETQLQDSIINLAHYLGWLVMHQRPARLANGGYRTAIQGDKGFPDLVLARRGRVIFAELKSEKGTLSGGQFNWQHELYGQPGVFDWKQHPEYYVWRPSTWLSGEIERILKG